MEQVGALPDPTLFNGAHDRVLHMAQAQQLDDIINHVAEVGAPLCRHAAQLGAVRQVLPHREVLVHYVILAKPVLSVMPHQHCQMGWSTWFGSGSRCIPFQNPVTPHRPQR